MPEREQASVPSPAPAGLQAQTPASDPGGRPPARISATPAAREAIRRLRAARGGSLMFVQSAGCCAGSVPMCFPEGEYLVGTTDLRLGMIEGCPFYIDARIYRSWNDAELILDVAPGDPEGFSLGPGGGQHFVIRSRAPKLARAGRNAACETGNSRSMTR